MNPLLLPAIVVIVGEICLLLDLGNRLFGSYARTPSRALLRIAVVSVAGAVLALPLALAASRAGIKADVWLGASIFVSVAIVGHFLLPYRFGIRRGGVSGASESDRPLSNGITLKTVTLERALPATRQKSISCLVLSDLHCNSTVGLRVVAEALRSLHDKRYDLIFILGDLGENTAILPNVMQELGALRPTHGTLCVRSNHDCEGGRAEIIERWARECSITLLANTAFPVPELNLSVVGLEHPWHPGPLPTLPESTFSIGLTHTPDNIMLFERLHVPIVLAGHTHGGKFALPLVGPLLVPSRYGRFLDSGWFQLRNTSMYITPGIGHFPGTMGKRGVITEMTIQNVSDVGQ